jgi:hypothetical protein
MKTNRPLLDLVDSYLRVVPYPTVVSISNHNGIYAKRYDRVKNFMAIGPDFYVEDSLKACPVDTKFKNLLIVDVDKIPLGKLKQKENLKKFDIIYLRYLEKHHASVCRSFNGLIRRVAYDYSPYCECIIFEVRFRS